jgi:hypothetical protein
MLSFVEPVFVGISKLRLIADMPDLPDRSLIRRLACSQISSLSISFGIHLSEEAMIEVKYCAIPVGSTILVDPSFTFDSSRLLHDRGRILKEAKAPRSFSADGLV